MLYREEAIKYIKGLIEAGDSDDSTPATDEEKADFNYTQYNLTDSTADTPLNVSSVVLNQKAESKKGILQVKASVDTVASDSSTSGWGLKANTSNTSLTIKTYCKLADDRYYAADFNNNNRLITSTDGYNWTNSNAAIDTITQIVYIAPYLVLWENNGIYYMDMENTDDSTTSQTTLLDESTSHTTNGLCKVENADYIIYSYYSNSASEEVFVCIDNTMTEVSRVSTTDVSSTGCISAAVHNTNFLRMIVAPEIINEGVYYCECNWSEGSMSNFSIVWNYSSGLNERYGYMFATYYNNTYHLINIKGYYSKWQASTSSITNYSITDDAETISTMFVYNNRWFFVIGGKGIWSSDSEPSNLQTFMKSTAADIEFDEQPVAIDVSTASVYCQSGNVYVYDSDDATLPTKKTYITSKITTNDNSTVLLFDGKLWGIDSSGLYFDPTYFNYNYNISFSEELDADTMDKLAISVDGVDSTINPSDSNTYEYITEAKNNYNFTVDNLQLSKTLYESNRLYITYTFSFVESLGTYIDYVISEDSKYKINNYAFDNSYLNDNNDFCFYIANDGLHVMNRTLSIAGDATFTGSTVIIKPEDDTLKANQIDTLQGSGSYVLHLGNKTYMMPTTLPPSAYKPNAIQRTQTLDDYITEMSPEVFDINRIISNSGIYVVGNVKPTKRNINALIKWGRLSFVLPASVLYVNADSDDYQINALATFDGLKLLIGVLASDNVNDFAIRISQQITL